MNKQRSQRFFLLKNKKELLFISFIFTVFNNCVSAKASEELKKLSNKIEMF